MPGRDAASSPGLARRILPARLVDLHAARPGEPHHPDVLRPGVEQLGDLLLQLGLVLAGVGVLDGERGRVRLPARLVREVADGDVGRPQVARVAREADVDAGRLHGRVGLQHLAADQVRARRRGGPVGMQRTRWPFDSSYGRPFADLICAEGARVQHGGYPRRHRSRPIIPPSCVHLHRSCPRRRPAGRGGRMGLDACARSDSGFAVYAACF